MLIFPYDYSFILSPLMYRCSVSIPVTVFFFVHMYKIYPFRSRKFELADEDSD